MEFKKLYFFVLYTTTMFAFGQYLPKWTLQGWTYPGYSAVDPTCWAYDEIIDGRFINVVKSEFLSVDENGYLDLKEDGFICNHNTATNYEFLRSNVAYNLVTISGAFNSAFSSFKKLLEDTQKINYFVNNALSFVVENDFDGVEINFEQFKLWQPIHWNNFKQLVTLLGDTLHYHSKMLCIIGPPFENHLDDNAVLWSYNQLKWLPVDYFVIMVYDYFYCNLNAPVAPLNWFKNVLEYSILQIGDVSKIVVGINSYGYTTSELIDIDNCHFAQPLRTFSQILQNPNYLNATRDPDSYELFWEENGDYYWFSDALSLSKKLLTAASYGITNFSVWHLGGNPWFDEGLTEKNFSPDSVHSVDWSDINNLLILNKSHAQSNALGSEVLLYFILKEKENFINANTLKFILIGSCTDCGNDSARIEVSISGDGGNSYFPVSFLHIRIPFDISYEILCEDSLLSFIQAIYPDTLIVKIKALDTFNIRINTIRLLSEIHQPAGDTIVIKVSSSTDDARNSIGGGAYNHTVYTQYIGNYNSVSYIHGLRFENIPFDDQTVFDLIILELFYAGISSGDTINARIYVEDSNSPTTFTHSNGPYHRTSSVQYCDVKIFDLPEFESGFGFLNFDVTELISNHLSKNFWNKNDNLVIIIESLENHNNTFVGFSTFDRDPKRGANLKFVKQSSFNYKRNLTSIQNEISLLKILPNPATEWISIKSDFYPLEIKLYNVWGQCVHSSTIKSEIEKVNLQTLKQDYT
ncbi:glycosyl hydrolase family 18 protein [Schleiferia thermophila]|jgi:hypothetical protein|uniref:Glycosyl hydrolase family 18 (Putative chitinase) n=2 Tax=Schleiferia thermophila TaxID=884107 RepID=A0A369A9D3_9FLAO|nr:glycosyl hydrolase family 18 protein [Schleiferia thermophila]RCX05018.1 glycosyl hydrolase family 18 (putative chitinase) [Schleiferia thermophila]GCD79464.1 hypothetical protein JCM30197_07110 [Schleiferia thermophila]